MAEEKRRSALKKLRDEMRVLLRLSPERRVEVRQELIDDAIPGVRYYILMTVASLISGLGLVINSPAVIIGAMLISPLMSPIFGVALGLIRGNTLLARRAFAGVVGGVALGVASGFLIGILPLRFDVTPEMLARTQPTLLDLGVAMLAGFAGCLALVDERMSPVLPGIAIATSLVPPLAASGLCFALGAPQGGLSAALLFVANFLAMLLVAGGVFIAAGFASKREMGSRKELMRRFSIALVSLILVAGFLSFTLYSAVTHEIMHDRVKAIFEEALAEEPATTLDEIHYKRRWRAVDILAVLKSAKGLRPKQVKALEIRIQTALNRDTRLVVRNHIVRDVSATGSTSAIVNEDLDGRFISRRLNPRVRRIQLAEQVVRERLDEIDTAFFRDIELVDVDGIPVVFVTIDSTRPVPADRVAIVEKLIRERLQDPKVRLVVRTEELIGMTRKGRMLLGDAHLAKLTDEQEAAQDHAERLARDLIENHEGLFAVNVDAVHRDAGWQFRAEVVGPRALKPNEVQQVEDALARELDAPAMFEAWCRLEIIVGSSGYDARETYSEPRGGNAEDEFLEAAPTEDDDAVEVAPSE
jgi:uncharacterized hydrophobic protein (TIGR00271 family)